MRKNLKKGFTLIEFLVVIFVIILVTAIPLVNYRSGEKQLLLNRSANSIAEAIREAQEMSLSSKEFSKCPQGVPLGGYGLYFYKGKLAGIDFYHQFLIFADCDGNHSDILGNEKERFVLENGVRFYNFYINDYPTPGTNFTFKPPDPQTCIDITTCNPNSTKIVIALEDDLAKTKTIVLYKSGLIEIY